MLRRSLRANKAPHGGEPVKQVSANAALPLILLVAAAGIESLRLPLMLLLLLGLLATLIPAWRVTGRPIGGDVLLYAACLLVAVNLVWDGVPIPASLLSASSCADPLAPFAVNRAVGALLVLACVGLVVRLIGARPSEIGLRWTSRASLAISLVAIPAVGTAAVLIGPPLAEPFFGPVPSISADLRGLVPALLFAVANASMEETVYRGALLRWLTPTIGMTSALALQAIVFGLAHGVGTDFAGSPLPVMAATAASGIVFGVLAIRTDSLVLPIALHIALDIPIYFGKACIGS